MFNVLKTHLWQRAFAALYCEAKHTPFRRAECSKSNSEESSSKLHFESKLRVCNSSKFGSELLLARPGLRGLNSGADAELSERPRTFAARFFLDGEMRRPGVEGQR